MEDLLQDCLFPVMLGANTACHTTIRQLQKRFGASCTVLTGKRALTLRFLPGVRLIDAAPTIGDEMLCTVLRDVVEESRLMVPLLIVCDRAYEPFVERNRAWLEAHFVVRSVAELELHKRREK